MGEKNFPLVFAFHYCRKYNRTLYFFTLYSGKSLYKTQNVWSGITIPKRNLE
jgi:hypothetical protein